MYSAGARIAWVLGLGLPILHSSPSRPSRHKTWVLTRIIHEHLLRPRLHPAQRESSAVPASATYPQYVSAPSSLRFPLDERLRALATTLMNNAG